MINEIKSQQEIYCSHKNEIDLFFEFLQKLEDISMHKKQYDSLFIQIFPDGNFVDAMPIMKAAAVLVLYNIIEPTIDGLAGIFVNFIKESCPYHEAGEYLQKVWLNSKKQALRDCAINNLIDNVKQIIDHGVFRKNLEILPKELIQFCKEEKNYDTAMIKKLFGCLGGCINRKCDSLNALVDKRNNLAHGRLTFKDVGQTLSMSDLFKIKAAVYDFLDPLFLELNSIIAKKLYIKKNSNIQP